MNGILRRCTIINELRDCSSGKGLDPEDIESVHGRDTRSAALLERNPVHCSRRSAIFDGIEDADTVGLLKIRQNIESSRAGLNRTYVFGQFFFSQAEGMHSAPFIVKKFIAACELGVSCSFISYINLAL
jgi:hypothetical protein